MEFSELLATQRLIAGCGETIIPADWMQVSLLLGAMRSRVSDALPSRTLQVSFIAPVPQDQTLRVASGCFVTDAVRSRLQAGDAGTPRRGTDYRGTRGCANRRGATRCTVVVKNAGRWRPAELDPQFLRDHLDDQPQIGRRMDLAMVAAGDGCTQQPALMWAPDGQAVALCRQTTVVFA